MDQQIYSSETHSQSGVDLTQIRELLSLSYTERLRLLEENTKQQLMLNSLAAERLIKINAFSE